MCDHCGCRSFAPIAELTADHEHILELAWEVAEGDWPDETTRRAAREEWEEMAQAHHAAAHQFGVAHTHDEPAADTA